MLTIRYGFNNYRSLNETLMKLNFISGRYTLVMNLYY